MRAIRISDITLKQTVAESLTFKEKLELVKILDRLGVDIIELPGIDHVRRDSLFVKTVLGTLKNSIVSLQVPPSREAIDIAAAALEGGKNARIEITAPVSLVQIEYIGKCSQEEMVETVTDAIRYAASKTDLDIAFCAIDAARAGEDYLRDVLERAIEAGAGTVSVCDTAGELLPSEAERFIEGLAGNVKGLSGAVLGFSASNDIAMADANSVAAAFAGAGEIKASIYPEDAASLENAAAIISRRGDESGMSIRVRTVEIARLAEKAAGLFSISRSDYTPFDPGTKSTARGKIFTAEDDMRTIIEETTELGYDLSDEDRVKVYEEFRRIVEKKHQISGREIDAIVASTALQVPATYVMDDVVINTGQKIASTAYIRLMKGDEPVESVALGDGPIDAAFLAIENITGRHYELEDYRVQTVTRGRQSMGETLVKMRASGKLYSGRGISTNILAASVTAYINALNKIIFEEDQK